jgi:hypothetical protein
VTSDALPALIGLVLFAVFVGFLAVSIGELALTLIVGAVILMAAADFWFELRS